MNRFQSKPVLLNFNILQHASLKNALPWPQSYYHKISNSWYHLIYSGKPTIRFSWLSHKCLLQLVYLKETPTKWFTLHLVKSRLAWNDMSLFFMPLTYYKEKTKKQISGPVWGFIFYMSLPFGVTLFNGSRSANFFCKKVRVNMLVLWVIQSLLQLLNSVTRAWNLSQASKWLCFNKTLLKNKTNINTGNGLDLAQRP